MKQSWLNSVLHKNSGGTVLDGATYTLDYENRLTQEVLAGTGGTATFKYDPFGRRVQKVFTKNGVTTTTNYLEIRGQTGRTPFFWLCHGGALSRRGSGSFVGLLEEPCS